MKLTWTFDPNSQYWNVEKSSRLWKSGDDFSHSYWQSDNNNRWSNAKKEMRTFVHVFLRFLLIHKMWYCTLFNVHCSVCGILHTVHEINDGKKMKWNKCSDWKEPITEEKNAFWEQYFVNESALLQKGNS